LADLISLRDVRIKITLAIELGKIGERAADCDAKPQNMSDGFAINNWQRARVRETDRTDVYIWSRLIRVVRGVAEHLSPSLELGMYFKPYGRTIFHSEQFTANSSQ